MATGSRRAACTIIAKNYLAHARVLARSFREHNADAEMFVLVVDAVDGHFEPAREPFTLVSLDDLPLDDRPALCLKYSVLELCTAVKPFLMQHLFNQFGVDQLLYLDPDILVLDTLAPLYDLTARHSIVLTPHITEPIDDDALPNETTFLQCGIYNLGFLGLADTPTTRSMLAWWQQRCAERCVVRLEEGLFVDQKWMDLVPVLFKDVAIVTDPGYNVAYWNLHGRKIAPEGKGWSVNGERLRFFHFSGYELQLPDAVSKHQTRYTVRQLGEAASLFADYRALLLEAGAPEILPWPYSYSRFDNGAVVSPIIRDLFYRLGTRRREFGNPFITSHPNAFFQWLNAPAAGEQATPPYISNLAAHVMNYRKDLREAFPRFREEQRPQFMDWMRSTGRWQLELDPRFLVPLARGGDDGHEHQVASMRDVVRAFSAGSCRLCPLVMLVDRHGYGSTVRSLLLRLFQRDAPAPPVAPAPPEAAPGRSDAVPDRAPAPARSRVSRYAAALLERTLRPCSRHHLVRNLATRDSAPLNGLSDVPSAVTAAPAAGFGVNLAGYLTTESGVGEAARLMAAAIKTVDLPHALVNFEASYNLRRADRTFRVFSASNPYAINLVHVNADQVPVFVRHYGADFFANRYNVGFWMWELAEFPEEWRGRFVGFDEIWTPSSFTTQAIARRSPVPVSTVPLPVPRRDPAVDGRARFGLPDGPFVFLFVFDFASVFERKNPLAVVEAFRRAFRDAEDVWLVLKYANADSDPESAARLREAARHARVRLIDGYVSRDDVTSLIAACDGYVSLHRSEGFGLTMAEAMRAGRIVIATGYSGNMEFMDPTNSFLVRYRLVDSPRDHGPYRKGTLWADPDLDHAAELMRWVVDHPADAARITAKARGDVEQVLGLDAVGRAVEARLREAWPPRPRRRE